MQTDRDKFNQQPQQQGAGRINHINETSEPLRPGSDISEVDCQEGEMNNGELGGNFREPSRENQPGQ